MVSAWRRATLAGSLSFWRASLSRCQFAASSHYLTFRMPVISKKAPAAIVNEHITSSIASLDQSPRS
jgi:hypothetical protein